MCIKNYRTPAFCLGLFFFLIFSLHAQEDPIPVTGAVSAGTGTLWAEDDGSALYWHSGLSLNLGQNFFIGFNFGQIISDLPWLDTSVLGFKAQLGIDSAYGGFVFTSGFFNHSGVSASIGKMVICNDGGKVILSVLKRPCILIP